MFYQNKPICSECYADSEKQLDICFKIIFTVNRIENWSHDIWPPLPTWREKWFSSLAETIHIIINGKLTKDKAKLFISEYNYRFIDIKFVYAKQVKNTWKKKWTTYWRLARQMNTKVNK